MSAGQRRVCTYYRPMTTCGDNDHVRDRNDPLFGLNGKSLEQKRLETLMTATGFIRGSFVRKLLK